MEARIASGLGAAWSKLSGFDYWGFPKIRDTLLGVPRKRIIVFGVYMGFPSFWETTYYVGGMGALSLGLSLEPAWNGGGHGVDSDFLDLASSTPRP